MTAVELFKAAFTLWPSERSHVGGSECITKQMHEILSLAAPAGFAASTPQDDDWEAMPTE
ncbi:hypothetical protein E4U43_003698 [Claviceps pusilla]|uniref:Uncharacterized protein n=1 Tax=Claviceps pusilla TaxID=123648 RepID=A0A9P7N6H7_9HYPO|nr:hypothetical protein E4U43_003698 [Claviceps pusilla]